MAYNPERDGFYENHPSKREADARRVSAYYTRNAHNLDNTWNRAMRSDPAVVQEIIDKELSKIEANEIAKDHGDFMKRAWDRMAPLYGMEGS